MPLSFSPGKMKMAQKSTPPKNAGEVVTIKVFNNKVIEAVISYNTPRAGEHRQCIKSLQVQNPKCQNMLFIFHDAIGEPPQPAWNTLLRDFSDVTTDPVEAVEMAFKALSRCSAVSEVRITDAEGTLLSLDDVRNMAFEEFEPPGADEMVQDDDISAKLNHFEQQLDHLIGGHNQMAATLETIETDFSAATRNILNVLKGLANSSEVKPECDPPEAKSSSSAAGSSTDPITLTGSAKRPKLAKKQ